jgi:hypothetical protein
MFIKWYKLKIIASTVCAPAELLKVCGHMARDPKNHLLTLEGLDFALPFGFRAGFFWELVEAGIDPVGFALAVLPSLV